MGLLDRFRLDGRVAIVTGASSGLGVAFAEALADAGADVALGARRTDRLVETARLVTSHGRRAITLPTDVSRAEDCDNLAAAAMDAFGRVDILVNNAGIGAATPALRETEEHFRGILDVNLHGCFLMAQAAARRMEPGSSIVNVSSVLGLVTAGLPQAAYSASKAGLLGLTRDLAQQWTSRRGIRVNALAPGWFTSEMTDELPESYLESITAAIPSGRVGEPAELAAALIFLASDASSYVTGETLVVDGGLLIS